LPFNLLVVIILVNDRSVTATFQVNPESCLAVLPLAKLHHWYTSHQGGGFTKGKAA